MDEMENKTGNRFGRIISYILVAALSSGCTLFFFGNSSQPTGLTVKKDKLDELKGVIEKQYIGEADEAYMDDMAAAAMVAAVGDRWSYYIPADQMQAHEEQRANAYVGIGVTITVTEDETGSEKGETSEGEIEKEETVIKVAKTTGLKAKALSCKAITLTWKKVNGATGYQVYRYNKAKRKYVI